MAILSPILTLVGGVLAPLIIYLIKKEGSKFFAFHAKELLDFQINAMIIVIGLIITIVGLLVVWIAGISALVFVIIAPVKQAKESYTNTLSVSDSEGK